MCSSLFILSCVFLPLLVLCVKRDVPLLVPHDSLGCCPLTPYDVEERSMKNRCSLHEAIRTIPWHSLVLFLGMEIWWTMVFGGPWVFEPGHRNSQWERLRKGSLSCQNMKHHYPTPRPPPPPPPGLSTPLTEALCWFSPGADPQLSPHLGPWRQLLRSLSLPRLFSLTLVVPKDQLDSFRGIFLFLLSGRSLPESALSDAKDILLPVIVIAAGLSLGRFPVNNIFVIMKFRESWEEPVSEFLKS